jgi:GT2 family glycosyltransferase
MRQPEPTVSVIIPTYNRLPLLREAVDSVLAQTCTDWELIIADDGSTDGTPAYLEDLRRDDPRIVPLLLDHTGLIPVVRNAGVAASRGWWLAFLDSDDWWLPGKLMTQLDHLAREPRCRWSYTGYFHTDVRGTAVEHLAPAIPQPVSGWIAEPIITFTLAASITTLLVQRSFLLEVGGFDPELRLRSDYDLVLRLAVASEACGVPDELTAVRDHAARTTSGFPELAQLETNARVFRKAELQASTARLRALCARQRAQQLAAMTAPLMHEGHRGAALRTLMRAILAAPISIRTWRAVAAQIARSSGLRRSAKSRSAVPDQFAQQR